MTTTPHDVLDLEMASLYGISTRDFEGEPISNGQPVWHASVFVDCSPP